MGANMARRLKDKGFVITAVQDHNTAGAESLAQELSCEAAPSPARVAELSDVVLTVVTDDAAMDAIYSEDSPNSLLSHAEGRLFINFATVSPEAHMKAGARVEAKGGNQSRSADGQQYYAGAGGNALSDMRRQEAGL